LTHAADFETAFWKFSLDRYVRPGIREICLDLQDRFCADVNVVLLSLWAGQSGITLSGPDIRKVKSAGAAAWHADVLVPFRTARRNIRTWNAALSDPDIEAFRDRVKVLELEAERLTQRLLVIAVSGYCDTDRKTIDPTESTRALATQNLSNYLEIAAPRHSARWHGQVKTLVRS
jgi:uncharacterized protein (TIGR02444 family)